MAISAKVRTLTYVLENMRSHLGAAIEKSENFGDNRMIVIIRNSNFINIAVSKTIYAILDYFIRIRVINLVASGGAWGGEIDNKFKNITDQFMKRLIVDGMFENGSLTAAEYCLIFSTTPFILFGAEDKALYQQAMELWAKLAPLWELAHKIKSTTGDENMRIADMQKAIMSSPSLKGLFKDFEEFNELDHKRADVILKNLLRKMTELKCETSALVCTGNVPQYISKIAKEASISYAIIEPERTTIDDIQAYEKRIGEQIKSIRSEGM